MKEKKKIFIITSIKNESDIIESFIRYNLTYSDVLLVYENHKSSDNTREIVQKLIDEGLPIFFDDNEDMHYEVAKKMMIKQAFQKYGADFVIPLDADEFLCHVDGINPRHVLENMREDIEYQVPWRTYIYENEPCVKKSFIPDNFRFYRNQKLDDIQGHAGTVIISKYLAMQKKARPYYGTHWLVYPDEHKDTTAINKTKDLFCAHYPIRSQKQVMIRAIPNWINRWTIPERDPRSAIDVMQLGILFNELKENGKISKEKMKEISIEYSLFNCNKKEDIERLIIKLGDKLLVNGLINVSFCNEELKSLYTTNDNDDKKIIRAVLSSIDRAVSYLDSEIDELKQKNYELIKQNDEQMQLNKDLELKNNELEKHIDELVHHRNELINQNNDQAQQINEIYSSKTWEFGSWFAKVYRALNE
ncbi:MAG: glycosyltransferase family 2 protein [Oscillospiraceae bacterium]|jgi:hypothetical protein|nr:glycosyltransferase family 2 protein [Oscillospiraceae bacterium]